jgi:hypothetical protein
MSFQSYEYTKHLDYNPKTKEYCYEYKIIDDDWVGVGVEVGVAVSIASWIAVGVAIAVIQEYGKRGLSVADNLVRAFQWFSKKYGHSIEQIIAWNKQYSPLYKDYEKDVERYLVLL